MTRKQIIDGLVLLYAKCGQKLFDDDKEKMVRDYIHLSEPVFSAAIDDILDNEQWLQNINLRACLAKRLKSGNGVEKLETVMSQITVRKLFDNNYDVPKFSKEIELCRSLIVDLGGWPSVLNTKDEDLRYQIRNILKNGYQVNTVNDKQLGCTEKPRQLSFYEYHTLGGEKGSNPNIPQALGALLGEIKI